MLWEGHLATSSCLFILIPQFSKGGESLPGKKEKSWEDSLKPGHEDEERGVVI